MWQRLQHSLFRIVASIVVALVGEYSERWLAQLVTRGLQPPSSNSFTGVFKKVSVAASIVTVAYNMVCWLLNIFEGPFHRKRGAVSQQVLD